MCWCLPFCIATLLFLFCLSFPIARYRHWKHMRKIIDGSCNCGEKCPGRLLLILGCLRYFSTMVKSVRFSLAFVEYQYSSQGPFLFMYPGNTHDRSSSKGIFLLLLVVSNSKINEPYCSQNQWMVSPAAFGTPMLLLSLLPLWLQDLSTSRILTALPSVKGRRAFLIRHGSLFWRMFYWCKRHRFCLLKTSAKSFIPPCV